MSCVSFEFLLAFFVALAGISLLGEVNRVVTRLITRGVVVLRLLDSGEWSGEVFGLWQQRQFAIPDVA